MPATSPTARRLRAPMTGVDGVFHCRRLVQGRRRPGRGRAHQRRRHPQRAGDDARAGNSARRLHQHRRGVLGHARRDARRDATATTARTSVDYDRTKWQAHYEVALPMMADGLPLIDRDARPRLRPGRHQRHAHRAGGPAARAAADHAGAHRVLLGARRRHRARPHRWRWSRGGPARPTSSPARATPSRRRSIWRRSWPRCRAPLLHPGPRLMRAHGRR